MSRSPHRVPALVLGTGHAAVSAYWLTGGTALLDTIGGSLEEWARDRSGTAVAALAAVVVVKLVTAALGPLVAVRLTFDVTMYTDHRPREDRLTRPLLALTLPRGPEAGPVPGRKETRMTRWTTRALGGAAVVASVLGSGMGAAGADPKGGVTIPHL